LLTKKDYRNYSFWLDTTTDDLTSRPALPGDTQVDVAIVGGGYTGLWTAYYLAEQDPTLRICVLEREICGFGASGRNGGWASAFFAGSRERTQKKHGWDAAVALQRALFAGIDEIGRVAEAEGIDAHFHKGGTLSFVTSPAHLGRIRANVDYERRWGFGPEVADWLDAPEAKNRIKVQGALGAAFSPQCARLHPANLVRGLARAAERRGVTIYEGTEVSELRNGRVVTPLGNVTADIVVRATEGYTVQLGGLKRALAPIYSLMIATEPLPETFWKEVGWEGRETVNDGRHLLIYAQRTWDDRIAIGGRGAPYHFGSRIQDSFDREPTVFAELKKTLARLIPETSDAQVTHTWGGPVGVPRDWYSSVGFDRASGVAWAGGYVGDGVTTSNLAGRTLADLIAGRDTELTRLPWVGHRSRKWEPEPLRWVGTNLGLWMAASADRVEARTGRPARRARVIDMLLGDSADHTYESVKKSSG
jgi:glycine/D-amino acid oxidase-like deaminating enzyme